jgi:hypothetical protein
LFNLGTNMTPSALILIAVLLFKPKTVILQL